MEKKVAIYALIFLGLLSCTPKNDSEETKNEIPLKSDSVFYANDKVKPIELAGSKNIEHGLVYKTKGTVQSVWIDSIYFFQNSNGKHLIVFRTPELETKLLYFNGDSSIVEKIAANTPLIENYKLNDSNILSIIDSTNNSGFLIVSHMYFQIDNECRIKSRKEYFPQMSETSKKFDFIITSKLKNDTLEIFKDGVVNYKFY